MGCTVSARRYLSLGSLRALLATPWSCTPASPVPPLRRNLIGPGGDAQRYKLWFVSTEARVTTLEHALAELAVSQAHTNANLDRFVAEMRASSQAADKRWGELSNKMGTLAEDLVAPGIPTVFSTFFGLPDPEWRVRVWARHRTDRSRRREYDVVAWDGDVFLVNETKSQARPDDVRALLEAVTEARSYFVEADGRRVVGSLASFFIDPSLVRAAEREGLLVFGLGRGLLETLNSPGFKPREF